MDFKEIVQRRRSIRRFTEQPVDEQQLNTILRAALMSPTGHSARGWQFVVVGERDTLDQLAATKSAGADFLKEAPVAIVVAYDATASDVWVEDASIAAVTMQYQATELGLGSCWSQIRLRTDADGHSASEAVKSLLSLPETWEVECIIAFGYPAIERKMQDESRLAWQQVIKK